MAGRASCRRRRATARRPGSSPSTAPSVTTSSPRPSTLPCCTCWPTTDGVSTVTSADAGSGRPTSRRRRAASPGPCSTTRDGSPVLTPSRCSSECRGHRRRGRLRDPGHGRAQRPPPAVRPGEGVVAVRPRDLGTTDEDGWVEVTYDHPSPVRPRCGWRLRRHRRRGCGSSSGRGPAHGSASQAEGRRPRPGRRLREGAARSSGLARGQAGPRRRPDRRPVPARPTPPRRGRTGGRHPARPVRARRERSLWRTDRAEGPHPGDEGRLLCRCLGSSSARRPSMSGVWMSGERGQPLRHRLRGPVPGRRR